MMERIIEQPQYSRSGSKAGWEYYASEDGARMAGARAECNAQRREARGYDFGFQIPGEVLYMETGEYAGLWEVCVP